MWVGLILPQGVPRQPQAPEGFFIQHISCSLQQVGICPGTQKSPCFHPPVHCTQPPPSLCTEPEVPAPSKGVNRKSKHGSVPPRQTSCRDFWAAVYLAKPFLKQAASSLMGRGKAEQKNVLTSPTLEQGNRKPAQEGWQGREGTRASRNRQGNSGMSHLIPPHCQHQHPSGSAIGLQEMP